MIPYMYCGVSISYILCMCGRYLLCDGSADFYFEIITPSDRGELNDVIKITFDLLLYYC